MTAALAGVTVIIPTFNCACWIGEAIESALAQTVAPSEIIVVDDGSTDDTSAVLARFGSRIRLLTQTNAGVAAARNTGMRAASQEWIAFLDADDVWHPRKLELQLKAAEQNPQIALMGTELVPWPTEPLPELADCVMPQMKEFDRAAMAVKNHLTTSSIIMRRSIAQRVGEFDVALFGPEDHDYWLRVAEVARIAILPLPLTGYRCVPGSLSKRAVAMEAGMVRILRKLDARDFWRGDRWLRRRAYSFVNYSSAYLYGAAGDQRAAIGRLLNSLAWYPMPQRQAEVGVAYPRPKRLAVALLRWIGVKRADAGY
jgi:glycosyltransferase involved in cell wall biosynthesis